MKNKFNIVVIAVVLVVLASVGTVNVMIVRTAQAMDDSTTGPGEVDKSTSPSLPHTLFYLSESQSSFGLDANLRPTSEVPLTFSASQVFPAQVSIFYPTMGQSQSGSCWMGLRIDSNNNVYPINGNGFYKILPNGTLVNGVNDQNLFASGSFSFWGELDESGGKLYTAAGSDVRSAPFSVGSTFYPLISGLNGGQAITLGQGPLTGSLFATESANQVSRVTLSPLGLSVFASGASFFKSPEAIASAPDGTLYVANLGFNPSNLTKITAAGIPSIFQTGTVAQVNRAVAVDNNGNIYWSHANGINKYDASGNLLGTFIGPPDKSAYGNPMGAAFDSSGNLYIVDNFDCKKIYKYTIALFTVAKDFRFTNVNFTATPVELGTLLPQNGSKFNVTYVTKPKDGTVSSTNPGQLYGVITINGSGADMVNVTDTFGTQFDINPDKLGGGVEIIRVNETTGLATVITNTAQVTSASVDNAGNMVNVTIDLDTPLVADEKLMVYIKFQTALKGMLPDTTDFMNEADIVINGGALQTATATINFVTTKSV